MKKLMFVLMLLLVVSASSLFAAPPTIPGDYAQIDNAGVTMLDSSYTHGGWSTSPVNKDGLTFNNDPCDIAHDTTYTNIWLTIVGDAQPNPAWVEIDLGGLYEVNYIRIWNNNYNATVWGLDDVKVYLDNERVYDNGSTSITNIPAATGTDVDFSKIYALDSSAFPKYSIRTTLLPVMQVFPNLCSPVRRFR